MNYNLSNFSSSIKSLNTKYHTQLLINRYDYIQKRINKQIKKNKAQKRLGIELNNNVDYSFLHSQKFDQLMNSGFMLSSPNFINLLNEALQDYIQKEYTPKNSNYSSLIQKIDDVLPYLISVFDKEPKVESDDNNKIEEDNQYLVNETITPVTLDNLSTTSNEDSSLLETDFFKNCIKKEYRKPLLNLLIKYKIYDINSNRFCDELYKKPANYGVFVLKLNDLGVINHKFIQDNGGVKNSLHPMTEKLFDVRITLSHFRKKFNYGTTENDADFYDKLSILDVIKPETTLETSKANS